MRLLAFILASTVCLSAAVSASAYELRLAVESDFVLPGYADESPITIVSPPKVDGTSFYFTGRTRYGSVSGLYKWAQGTVSLVTDVNTPLPGGEQFWAPGLDSPELRGFEVGEGGVAVKFRSTTGEEAIFLDSGSGFSRIAQSGDAAPNDRGHYHGLGDFAVVGNEVVYHAVVDTGETTIIVPEKPPVPVLIDTVNRSSVQSTTALIDPTVTVPVTGAAIRDIRLVEAHGDQVVFTSGPGVSRGVYQLSQEGTLSTIVSDTVLVDGVTGWDNLPGELFPAQPLTITDDKIVFHASQASGSTLDGSVFGFSEGSAYLEFSGDQIPGFSVEFKYLAASGRYLVSHSTSTNGLFLYDLIDRSFLEMIVPAGHDNLPDGLTASTYYNFSSDAIDGDMVAFGVEYLRNTPKANQQAIYVALVPEPGGIALFVVCLSCLLSNQRGRHV